MADFGLDSSGFQRARLEDIKTQIEEAIIASFGEVNLEPDSVLGQLVGVFSVPASDTWQQLENVYNAAYAATADGVSLDKAVDLVGVKRLQPTKSRVFAKVTGAQGTLIPAGSQVSVLETNEIFSSVADGIITRSSAVSAVVSVTTVTNSFTYSLVVNGVSCSFTSDVSATLSEILSGLKASIEASEEPVTVELGATQITVNTNQYDLPFNITVGTGLSISSRSSLITFEADETGAIVVLPGTFTQIVTPISGWDSVTNEVAGIQGRDLETDVELRLRRAQSLKIVGAGSAEAIRSRILQQVQDVTAAFVYENRTNTTDASSRPPHSFEAVVIGGSDTDIANKIWEVKPAGIETYGNVSVLITDSNGDEQTIKFSRPTDIFVWVNCVVTIVDGEYPADGTPTIKQSILSHGQSLGVGEDVKYQEFFGGIYETAGIASVALTLATSATAGGTPGAYTAANIEIDPTEAANFAADRITVTVA